MNGKFFQGGITPGMLQSAIANPNDIHYIDMAFEAHTWYQTDHHEDEISAKQTQVLMEELVNTMEQREIPLNVLTSRYDLVPEDNKSLLCDVSFMGEKILPRHTNFVSWKNHWVYGAVVDFHEALLINEYTPKHYKYNDFSNTKLFVNMMHIPKPHRVAIIDYLITKNLMEDGQVRFCNNTKEWRRLLDSATNLNEKDEELHPRLPEFLNNLIRYAPDIFSPFKYHGERPTWPTDPSYDTGLVALEAETLPNIKFLTQKSYMPTLWKKPFCILGNANANNEMKKMGYELFDELFDYTGETEDINFLIRDDGVTTQFERYQNHYGKLMEPLWSIPRTPESYLSLKKDMKEKTDHNLSRTLEIVFDDDLIPEEVFKYAYSGHNARLIRVAREMVLNHSYFEHYLPVDKKTYDLEKYPF